MLSLSIIIEINLATAEIKDDVDEYFFLESNKMLELESIMEDIICGSISWSGVTQVDLLACIFSSTIISCPTQATQVTFHSPRIDSQQRGCNVLFQVSQGRFHFNEAVLCFWCCGLIPFHECLLHVRQWCITLQLLRICSVKTEFLWVDVFLYPCIYLAVGHSLQCGKHIW